MKRKREMGPHGVQKLKLPIDLLGVVALELTPNDAVVFAQLSQKCHQLFTKHRNVFFYRKYKIMYTQIYVKCVQNSAWFITKIGHQYQNLEICKAAVEKDGRVISSINPRFQTEEMCLLAITSTAHAWYKLSPEQKTPKVCRKFLELYPDWLNRVDPIYQTPDICLRAVQKEGRLLEHVRNDLRTFEVCKAAVNKSGSALEFVPPNFWTKELCEIAVSTSPPVIAIIPKDKQSNKMIRDALNYNLRSNIKYVNTELLTTKQIMICLRNFAETLNYLHCPTEEMYLEAVKKYPEALLLIKKPSPQVCQIAIRQKPKLLLELDPKFHDLDLYITAVTADPHMWPQLRQFEKACWSQ